MHFKKIDFLFFVLKREDFYKKNTLLNNMFGNTDITLDFWGKSPILCFENIEANTIIITLKIDDNYTVLTRPKSDKKLGEYLLSEMPHYIKEGNSLILKSPKLYICPEFNYKDTEIETLKILHFGNVKTANYFIDIFGKNYLYFGQIEDRAEPENIIIFWNHTNLNNSNLYTTIANYVITNCFYIFKNLKPKDITITDFKPKVEFGFVKPTYKKSYRPAYFYKPSEDISSEVKNKSIDYVNYYSVVDGVYLVYVKNHFYECVKQKRSLKTTLGGMYTSYYSYNLYLTPGTQFGNNIKGYNISDYSHDIWGKEFEYIFKTNINKGLPFVYSNSKFVINIGFNIHIDTFVPMCKHFAVYDDKLTLYKPDLLKVDYYPINGTHYNDYIICCPETEIPCNLSLIQARAHYFKAVANFSETKSINSKYDLSNLIDFIYNGKADIKSGKTELIIADYYQCIPYEKYVINWIIINKISDYYKRNLEKKYR